MTAMNMPTEVEARIRAMPGNQTCVDCNNNKPQWASVSYGTLVCLECSGQHRSLGVHLSFVRSVQMDSWTARQIQAMERSGGNAAFNEYLSSRGIAKSMPIATKYNTKQAAHYRECLSCRLDGKAEPSSDPGQHGPTAGGSDPAIKSRVEKPVPSSHVDAPTRGSMMDFDDMWDSWGDEPKKPTELKKPTTSNLVNASADFDDEWNTWGDEPKKPAAPKHTKENTSRLAPAEAPQGGVRAPPAAAAPPAVAPAPARTSAIGGPSPEKPKKKTGLLEADDFFSEFGL